MALLNVVALKANELSVFLIYCDKKWLELLCLMKKNIIFAEKSYYVEKQ